MDQKNQKLPDGGPVYPCDGIVPRDAEGKLYGRPVSSTGMTLRQHYAGQAMQGMVSSIHSDDDYARFRANAAAQGLSVSQWIASDSFKQADAMLEVSQHSSDRDALARAILAWWEIHQYDTAGDGEGGERNVYDDEPEFVTLAIATGVQP